MTINRDRTCCAAMTSPYGIRNHHPELAVILGLHEARLGSPLVAAFAEIAAFLKRLCSRYLVAQPFHDRHDGVVRQQGTVSTALAVQDQ